MSNEHKPIADKSVREIKALERANQCLKLREGGLTFAEIAREVGYANVSTAKRGYDMACRERDRNEESIDDVRKLEVARLNGLWRPMYVAALRGDRLAADRCLKIMERRAALLGLDAPIRVQQVTITQEQFIEAIERMEQETRALESQGDFIEAEGWEEEEGA